MALNFNTQPYHDDFDEDKNFHKILFKPGVSVQARELTQVQSILQDQTGNRERKRIRMPSSIPTIQRWWPERRLRASDRQQYEQFSIRN